MSKKTKNKDKNKKKNKGKKTVTKELSIRTDDFSLSSSWKCKEVYDYSGASARSHYWTFDTNPSTASTKVKFKWSIPSGGKIKKSEIWATLGSPNSGISVCTMNGSPFNKNKDGARGMSVSLSGTGDTFVAEFKFKANGTVYEDTDTHSGVLSFSNVYLYIEYTSEGKEEEPSEPKRKFEVPPQSACIYDETSKGVYLFDGVLKIQHNISVKLEEEPEKNQDEYINNARNEPDKVVFDVRMSDVYTNGKSNAEATKLNSYQEKAFKAAKKALIDNRNARSTTIYQTMHWLKEQRRKLTVITPHYIYVDMIITSLTINQDEGSPFGWEGQITFQSAFKTKEQQKNQSSGKPTDVQPPSPSMASGIVNW